MATPVMTNVIDPWESAENPKEIVFTSEYWGQVEVKCSYCVLEKGSGRVPFDAQTHSADKRCTAIDLLLHPLEEMNFPFDVIRGMIAESREWAGTVLPSLRDLGVQLRELNGNWAKIELVPKLNKDGSPDTYVDKSGVVKELTTIRFMAVFQDEAACKADYAAHKNGHGASTSSATGAPTTATGSATGNPERTTALQFLKVYVQNAVRGQTDLGIIRETLALNIAQQALISKYFTVDSPETAQLIMESLGK